MFGWFRHKMGCKQSRNSKRYRAADRQVTWNYDDNVQFPIYLDPSDPIHDPEYIYEEDTNIWVHREGSDTISNQTEDGADGLDIHSLELLYMERETVECMPVRKNVPNQPEHVEFPLDHYDIINESDIDSAETDLKKVISARGHDPHRYHLFPLPSVHPQNTRRHHYEDMVKIFQPLIVSNVLTRRILPHLPFVSDPERIRAIDERDPRAAVIYLLDELCSNTNTEPGRWKQFIEALERSGYQYIVDTLRGHEPIDYTYQREYLKIITPALRELITPSELLPFLWAVDVISNEDREEINQIERNMGCLAAADKLMDAVPRRHKYWYSHLVDALKNADMSAAAEMLAIPEIQNNIDGEHDDVHKDARAVNKSASKANASKSELAEDKCRRETDKEESCVHKYLDMEEYVNYMVDISVPDNCDYLDNEIFSERESADLDDLYFHMHNAVQDTETRQLNNIYSSSICIPKEQPNASHDWTLYDDTYLDPDEIEAFKDKKQQALAKSCLQAKRENDQSSNTSERSHNQSDVNPYEYEPPIPAMLAPRQPNQEDSQGCLQSATDEYASDTYDSTESETENIEVVPLPVIRNNKNWNIPIYCRHTPFPNRTLRRDTAISKPPIPTPREHVGIPLTVVDIQGPLLCSMNKTGSMQHRLTDFEHEEKTNIEDVEKTNDHTAENVERNEVTCSDEDTNRGADKTTIRQALAKTITISDITDNTSNIGRIVQKYENAITKPPVPTPREHVGNYKHTIPLTVVDRQGPLIDNMDKTGSRRISRKKVKATTLISKCKSKRLQRSKLSNGRKTRNCKSIQPIEEAQMMFDTGKACDRMLTPKVDRNRSRQDYHAKSKSWPSVFGEHRQKEDTGLQQPTGNDINVINDDTDKQPQYYSEPFRNHRGREDEDIFSTVEQCHSNRYIDNKVSKVDAKNLTCSQDEATLCTHSKQRNIDKTEELLDILQSFNNGITDEDYILKSSVELKTITKENLNTDLRNDLEKVRDLKVKLNNLIHGEKVKKNVLALQEDVNEVLKRNRDVSSRLSIKEKEAKALEAAMCGENTDPEEADQFVQSNCAELCRRTDFKGKQHSVHTNKMSTKFSFETVQLPITTDSQTREDQKGIIQNDTMYNDSGIYSELSTYL